MSPQGPLSRMDDSHIDHIPDEFEQRTRALLEDGVTRLDARIRSRLNRARHAAIEEASRNRSSMWKRFSLMPAASAVAAAALVAFVLWPHPHQRPGESLLAETGGHSTVEDLDLLADGDALDLVSEETDGGAFLEWAAEQQTDSSETSS
jgi:ferric-dicitrate binding protein FerR (iron transport regulator)